MDIESSHVVMIDIKQVSEDNRGKVYSYKIGDREYILVTFKKGISRGGHYHHESQWHIVIAGKVRVQFHDMETEEEWEEVLYEGQSIKIPPMVSHLFTAEEESVVAESHKIGAETTNYPPQRKFAQPK